MSGCSQEMREKNPQLSRKFESKFGEDIFDRAPRPPEDFFNRRPKRPGIKKSWWGIVKSVDIDFKFITDPDDRGYMSAGFYNPVKDEITINLSAWKKGGGNVDGTKRSDEMTDYEFQNEVIEVITHEGGHAAALSKQGADLMRDLIKWSENTVFSRMDNYPTEFQIETSQMLSLIVHYLVNEYIADVIAGKDKRQALQNAWDQTVVARIDEWTQLLEEVFLRENRKDESAMLMLHRITGQLMNINPYMIVNELLPLLDKYFNNINKILFNVYRTGIPQSVQSNWEMATDEKTKEEWGHDFPFDRTESRFGNKKKE